MKRVSSHYEKRLKEHPGVVSLHPESTLMNETNPASTWIVPLGALTAQRRGDQVARYFSSGAASRSRMKARSSIRVAVI